jgi:GTP cyclohydrolase I
MSRLMRSFYATPEETFSFDVMERALDAYKADLGACDARLRCASASRSRCRRCARASGASSTTTSRSSSWSRAGRRKKIFHLDYVYASTCPCSLELSEHARQTRGQLAVPHAQRSVARLSVEVLPGQGRSGSRT